MSEKTEPDAIDRALMAAEKASLVGVDLFVRLLGVTERVARDGAQIAARTHAELERRLQERHVEPVVVARQPQTPDPNDPDIKVGGRSWIVPDA